MPWRLRWFILYIFSLTGPSIMFHKQSPVSTPTTSLVPTAGRMVRHCVPQTWSTWMVADPRQGSAGAVGAAKVADALRHRMGDALISIKVPAKCAARLGQCFSTTVDAARVDDKQMVSLSGCSQP